MKRLIFSPLLYLLIFSTAGCTPTEGINKKASAAYMEVIADYQKMVKAVDDYVSIGIYDDDPAKTATKDVIGENEYELYRKLADAIFFCRNFIVDDFYDVTQVYPLDCFGYALKDLNGNGSDELVLLLGNYYLIAVFSLLDGEPILLDSFLYRYLGAINDKGQIIIRASGGATYTTWYVYQISKDGGRLDLIEEFGYDGTDSESLEIKCYRMIDGDKKVIEETELDMLLKMFCDTELEEITKESGLEFIQLFDDND